VRSGAPVDEFSTLVVIASTRKTMAMDYRVEWGGSPQDVTVRTSGTASAAGALAVMRELAEDERYQSGLKILIDHSELQPSEYSPDDMDTQIDFAAAMGAKLLPAFCAIVAPKPVIYGLSRVWEAEIGGVTEATTRLFHNKEEAIAWLRKVDVGCEDASGV